MSNKSVGMKGLIPQISKAHGRMIIIGHNIAKVDKEAYDETWCRAIIMKPSKPYTYTPAIIYSRVLPHPFRLTKISQTTIKFDPYDLAPFTERPEKQVYFKEESLQKLWEWSNGKSSKDMGMSRMQINRIARDYVKRTLEEKSNM